MIVTGVLSSGAALYIGSGRLFVVIGIDDLLAAVGEVAQDTDDILHALVVHVVLIDGAAHQVQQGFDHTFLQPQSLSRFDPCRTHIPTSITTITQSVTQSTS